MKYRAIFKDEEEKEETKHKRKAFRISTAGFFMIFVLLLNLAAVLYIKLSHTIYFWDNATYWDISRQLARQTVDGEYWKNIYESIASQDYNYIAGILSAGVIRHFGEARLWYILSLVNFYLLPAYIMIYALACRIGKAPEITFLITFLLFPVMLFLTLNGFADIGGADICLICFLLYYPKNEKRFAVIRHIMIGVLLVFAMLWRRYFAFFAVSFITAMAADCLLFHKKKLPVILTVLTSGAVLFFGFRGFLTERLMRDYGTLYSGYKFALSTDFKLTARYFGAIFVVALFAAAVAVMIKKKDFRPLFMMIQIIVCFTMFVLTQTHGQQHLLLYVPSLAVMTIIAIRHISEIKLLTFTVILAMCQTVSVFVPRTQPGSIREIRYYAPIANFSMLPVKNSMADSILQLKNKLDKQIGNNQTLGVLASSFRINEDIIKNVQPSLGQKSSVNDYVVSLPQVDSRDKDMSAFYNVNYILAAFPAQTHLEPSAQRVVTEAVKSFEVYADIAEAYEEIPEFETVIDGITLKLYKRVKEVMPNQMREFEGRLK